MATYDNAAGQSNDNSSFTFDLAVNAAATVGYVFVAGATDTINPTDGVTAVTWGGSAMTRVYTSPSGLNATAADVYRIAGSIPTGTVTISVTKAGGGYAPVTAHALSITGADTTTPDDGWTREDEQSSDGNPYTASATIAGAGTSDLAVSFLTASTSFGAPTVNGAQTVRQSTSDSNGAHRRLGTSAGGSPNVTHGYDLDADAGGRPAWFYVANINDAAAGVRDDGGAAFLLAVGGSARPLVTLY
jgi:hypothetical protein